MDYWTENCILLHFMLGQQLELTDELKRFITVENSTDYNKAKDPIPFRRRVFSSDLDGRPIKGKDVLLLIESDVFKRLDDNDAVSLCCVGILQLVLLGVEDRRPVPNWILWLANDRVSWDNYPWGSYVWPTLYKHLRDVNVKRWQHLYVSEPANETDTKSYSIEGFAWAFKTWIFESFRAATDDYYTRYRRHPRIVAWSSKHKFYLNMLKPMLHVIDDVTITGVHQTDNYFNYETVDPDKVTRDGYVPMTEFLLDPYDIYLDCYMKGYKLPSFFWPQLVPHLYTYRREWSWPEGWLSSDILIRGRTENANWTLAKSGTVCLHPEYNRFMILTDPHNIETLDGSVRPFPSWNDVTWVLI
nr:phospholipase-like protein [Tanacetum cinerariifolium]